MAYRHLIAAALLSISTSAAAEPWELYFADTQDYSKIHVATFDVWDEDGNMHPRLPETFNRTQCLFVADMLSRSSRGAHPDEPDKGKYGCEPTEE
jgi:hypothetical protein